MKIMMIKPNIGMLHLKNGIDVPFNDKGRMEPLQLGVLAGLTPTITTLSWLMIVLTRSNMMNRQTWLPLPLKFTWPGEPMR